MSATAGAGLASVIVLGRDRPGSLRRCVAALLRHTRRPWELIAVVDGPDDGTAAYLRGVKDAAPIRVEVLTGAEDLGWPAACGGALAAARGDYIVLLDAAAVVADGWLDQLVALAESDPAIGLVGPMSDGAEGAQRAEGPAEDDPAAVERFAARWRDERRGKWFVAEALSGPCVLLKRRVLETIGPLAARPGLDPIAELAARARRAGVAAAVAYDLFVHRPPRSAAISPPAGRVATIEPAEFARRFGDPDTSRALCGYTKPHDTHAVLTLLAHARPLRVLEVGTALGHMTANLAAWSPAEARVYSLGVVRGMDRGGAVEQGGEAPDRADFGRLAGALGAGDKVELIVADSRSFDFRRLAPLDFAFVDGGHGLELATADSRGAYEALAPGGWLVWHDFDSQLPWVRVREAIERLALTEPVHRVAGTEVAFLRKAGSGPDPTAAATAPAAAPGPLRVQWEGDHRGVHSLGLINRALLAALLDRGHDLGIDPGGPLPTDQFLPPDPRLDARLGRGPVGGPAEVRVVHRWPPRLDPPREGRWVIFQPWEFGSLPRAWLPAIEKADEVWAYSEAVRQCYLDAGVPGEKVHVVPLGVDPDIFRPGLEPWPLPPGPRFRLLFVGGTIHRKGIDVLLEAFARAFAPGDGVGLVVQDMGAASFYRGQTAGDRVAALRDRGYAVEYRAEALTPPELARLYAACDCLVQPYRGEGFALPVAEAMACGRAVIVTGAGPALDYAGPGTAYLVPARRVELPGNRVGDIETVGRPWLWEPDGDALTGLLRRVAGDPAAARAKGEAASAWVRGRFTWAHAAAAAEARLRELVDRPTTGRVAVAPGAAASSGTAAPTAAAPARRAKVSLTMIVKDEEANLPACLGSAAGIFDEVVVLDTGSTDRTAEIAREHGARVFDFVWVNDFAAARNAALARATGDFAFWLDADDVLDPDQRERLRALLAGLRADDPAAYVVRCRCDPGPDGTGGDTVVDHIRLFPVREDIRWAYAVHEQILPALRRAGIPVRWTDVVVRHTGYTDPALRGRKLDRDAAILEAELAERPDDPFVLFNLGAIAVERQDWRAALDPLRRSLAGSAPADSITRKLYALIARCHQMLGERALAIQTCNLGLGVVPDDAELLFRRAVLHRHGGDLAAAEADWGRILTLRRPEQFSSVDQGIFGHLTRRNLATLCEARGDAAGARRHWEAVLAECPGDRDATEHLARLGAAGGAS